MNKSYALLISFLIVFFIYLNIPKEQNIFREELVVQRVIDGDTLIASNRTFRLANINSPEKGFFGFSESRDFLSVLINKTIEVETVSLDNREEREVARIYYNNNYVNYLIVYEGYASKAWVEKEEIELFNKAEKEAIDNEKGIWKKSVLYGCLNVSLDKLSEEVKINYICKNLPISGLVIKDESRENLVFNLTSKSISIYSGKSAGLNEDGIKWSSNNIWNNDADSIYIFDRKGDLIYYSSYGYD